jgi:hypothetical protein
VVRRLDSKILTAFAVNAMEQFTGTGRQVFMANELAVGTVKKNISFVPIAIIPTAPGSGK